VLALDEEGVPQVPKSYREALGVAAGDRVFVTPLP
jgi:bifunctional DNA-binding transcriptional regulator/antitoxin component of YhaV-PrlF toxin-antitoxin module